MLIQREKAVNWLWTPFVWAGDKGQCILVHIMQATKQNGKKLKSKRARKEIQQNQIPNEKWIRNTLTKCIGIPWLLQQKGLKHMTVLTVLDTICYKLPIALRDQPDALDIHYIKLTFYITHQVSLYHIHSSFPLIGQRILKSWKFILISLTNCLDVIQMTNCLHKKSESISLTRSYILLFLTKSKSWFLIQNIWHSELGVFQKLEDV